MRKILAVFLALAAFLAVCLYWLWQMATGRPALAVEEVALRAVLAMVAAYIAGRFIGRLGVSVISEAWQEAQARSRDRAAARALDAAGGESPATEPPGGAEPPARG